MSREHSCTGCENDRQVCDPLTTIATADNHMENTIIPCDEIQCYTVLVMLDEWHMTECRLPCKVRLNWTFILFTVLVQWKKTAKESNY